MKQYKGITIVGLLIGYDIKTHQLIFCLPRYTI